MLNLVWASAEYELKCKTSGIDNFLEKNIKNYINIFLSQSL